MCSQSARVLVPPERVSLSRKRQRLEHRWSQSSLGATSSLPADHFFKPWALTTFVTL